MQQKFMLTALYLLSQTPYYWNFKQNRSHKINQIKQKSSARLYVYTYNLIRGNTNQR